MSERLKLPARLDLSSARALLDDLTQMNAAKGLTLDASDVTHLGAICVQSLISAARMANAAGGHFILEGVSDRVEAQLAAMGLSSETLAEGAR